MVLGVVLFALAMIAASSTNRFYWFSRRPFVRRTLYIGYSLRIAASIILPIGMFIDLPSGLFVIMITDNLFRSENEFLATLVATLLQGTALNIIVGLAMVPIWGIQKVWILPKPLHATSCAKCGYDRVATSAGAPCPECGSSAGYADIDSTPLSRTPWLRICLFLLGAAALALLIFIFIYGNALGPHILRWPSKVP